MNKEDLKLSLHAYLASQLQSDTEHLAVPQIASMRSGAMAIICNGCRDSGTGLPIGICTKAGFRNQIDSYIASYPKDSITILTDIDFSTIHDAVGSFSTWS